MNIAALFFIVLFTAVGGFFTRLGLRSARGQLRMGELGGPNNPDTHATEEVWLKAQKGTAKDAYIIAALSFGVVLIVIIAGIYNLLYLTILVPAFGVAIVALLFVRSNLRASRMARQNLGLSDRNPNIWRDNQETKHVREFEIPIADNVEQQERYRQEGINREQGNRNTD